MLKRQCKDVQATEHPQVTCLWRHGAAMAVVLVGKDFLYVCVCACLGGDGRGRGRQQQRTLSWLSVQQLPSSACRPTRACSSSGRRTCNRQV